jgi:hypothetical protein
MAVESSDLFERLVAHVKSDPIPVGVVVVTLIVSVVYLYKTLNGKEEDALWATTGSNDISTPGYTKSSKGKTKLKNVWDVINKGKNSITKQSGGEEDKQFYKSKYYYAHNNPNATGGYKDGLKMEDYTMNGPRLLSKGGPAPANGRTPIVEQDAHATEAPTEQVQETKPKKISIHDPNVMNITKYLWDDPGDWNGIATVRIDTLPAEKIGGTTLDWKEVEIKDVKANLIGEGLLVEVEADQGRKYQLKINKLYGDAAYVKTMIKPKRLLVRIYKKKNSVLAVRDESNLEAWPTPHRRV